MMEYMLNYIDPLVCSFYLQWLDRRLSATKQIDHSRYLEDLLFKVGVSAIETLWLDLA